MSEVKLLPCPFCGRDEHLQVEHLEGTVVHPAYRVSCDNCGASTGYTDTDCRKVWNERANMEPLIAENERLRESNARLRRSLNEAIVYGNRQTGRAEQLEQAHDLLEKVKLYMQRRWYDLEGQNLVTDIGNFLRRVDCE